VSVQYGRRDETCPFSTEGGTRRVQLVREGGNLLRHDLAERLEGVAVRALREGNRRLERSAGLHPRLGRVDWVHALRAARAGARVSSRAGTVARA
jgi:hypothetical protein